MTDQIPIIDERENPFKSFLGLHPEYPFQIATLEIGDILLPDFPLENKRITSKSDDLKESFFGEKDRIHEQSYQRYLHYNHNGLIVQLECDFHYDENYTREKVEALFATLITDFDTHLFYTSNIEETVHLIWDILWVKILRGEHKMTCERKEAKPLTLPEMQVYFISSFYNTGYKTSIDLLKAYGDPLSVIENLCNIEITFTKGNHPRNPVVPEGLKGVGPQFFLKNKPILVTRFDLKAFEKAQEMKRIRLK